MHIKIRTDILNGALHIVATTSGGELPRKKIYPDSENDWLTFDKLAKEIPAISDELWNMTSKWENEGPYSPTAAFFSIKPPGTWMRLRKLIGPDAMEDPWNLNAMIASEEALGVVLQRFMEELEKQQDEWNNITFAR